MSTENSQDRTTLYFKEGSSDKVYHAAIEPAGNGFVVNFAYGRRGGTLATGTKTNTPVPYDAAKKIFDKLVKEKSAKGYTPGESGTPYQQTGKQDRATGIVPQLCNPIAETEGKQFIADADWWAQEKLDGKRVLIRRVDHAVTGINRQGLVIELPEPMVAHARTLGSQHWLMDGEAIGDTFFAFDLLESACVDLRNEPYRKRLRDLEELVSRDNAKAIRFVETATTAPAKQAMFDRLKGLNREGLVFKRRLAKHSRGRPASGGDWLKLKFTASASCLVAGVNGSRRSVRLELLNGDARIGVGNVTIPTNHPIPAKGKVVEVRYLYAYAGGALYQPVYLGIRDDIAADSCTVSQLKLKSEEGEDDT